MNSFARVTVTVHRELRDTPHFFSFITRGGRTPIPIMRGIVGPTALDSQVPQSCVIRRSVVCVWIDFGFERPIMLCDDVYQLPCHRATRCCRWVTM